MLGVGMGWGWNEVSRARNWVELEVGVWVRTELA